MLWKRIVVNDHERMLAARNGRFRGIFTPGEYRLFTAPGMRVTIERHDVRDLVFRSKWADYLVRQRPELVERHFTVVRTNHRQVAMVYADGELFKVLLPAKRILVWRGAAEVTVEVVNVIVEPEFPVEMLDILEFAGSSG